MAFDMELTWSQFKDFFTARAAQYFYVDDGRFYHLKSKSGLFEVYCKLYKDATDTTDLDDWEDNYKSASSTNYLDQSVNIKLARGQAGTITGSATIYIPIPTEGRTINGGAAFFGSPSPGDYVRADVYDKDNVLGGGAVAISSFDDEEQTSSSNKGWYMQGGAAEIAPLVNDDQAELYFGGLQLYLRIRGTKANILSVDTLYCNIRWGKRVR